MSDPVSDKFEQASALALDLSPIDKVRLVEKIMATLEQDLQIKRPRRSLLGVLAAHGPAPSAEEIAEARRELWNNFPREDL